MSLQWELGSGQGSSSMSQHFICWVVSRNYKKRNTFVISIISRHQNGVGSWNLSSCKTGAHFSCIVNTIAAADVARVFIPKVLIPFSWIILAWMMSPIFNGLTKQEAPELRHVSCPWAVPLSHLSLCNGAYWGIGAGYKWIWKPTHPCLIHHGW